MDRLSGALEELKRRRGWSLRALARELGVSPSTAESWIKGWRTPDLERVPAIADALGETPGEVASWLLAEVLDNVGDDHDGEAPIIHGMTAPRFSRSRRALEPSLGLAA